MALKIKFGIAICFGHAEFMDIFTIIVPMVFRFRNPRARLLGSEAIHNTAGRQNFLFRKNKI
jgi:hypothetical protein